MPSASAIPDAIAEQAADWIVRLTAGDATEQAHTREAFESWKRENPLHAEAAADLQQVLGRLDAVRAVSGGHPGPAQAAIAAGLKEGTARRARRIATTLAIVFLLGLPVWLGLQHYTPGYLLADLRSGTGQWETRTLVDGTRVTLGSGSAVNLRFDAKRRVLDLVRGEILVDVAHDTERPFLVETADGSIRALGTQFTVDRRDDATVLTMLQSKVAVQTASQRARNRSDGGDRTVVEAGERVRIMADGLGPIEHVDTFGIADAWQTHQLVARKQPLTDVLDELERHRPGRILYDRDRLAGIDMTVVLPLDNTDQALQLLVDSLPALRVRKLTPWLVLVDRQPDR